MDSPGLSACVDRHFPQPGSNRGLLPSVDVKTLILTRHTGEFRLDDIDRLQRDNKALLPMFGPETHSRRDGEHSGRPGSALRVNLSAPLSSQGMNLSQEWRVRGVRIPAKAEIQNSKMTKTSSNLYLDKQTERECLTKREKATAINGVLRLAAKRYESAESVNLIWTVY